MAFDFSKLNKATKKTIKDGINLDNMGDFQSLKNFIGKEIPVDGFFFTKSKFGEQVVLVGLGCKINLPKRFTEDFKAIRDNDEALADIIAGNMKIVNIHEIDSANGKTVTFDYANA